MIETATASHGRLDIVVNNAGIQHVAPLEEFPPEKWDAILAINLSSAFHTTRLALPGMIRNKWGRIINIASAHGLVASPFKSAYVAAKHGMVGLTKVTALETAEQGITCNAICPGYVWTPLVEEQIEQQAKAHGISARRGDPRRAAGAAAQQAVRHGRRDRRARRLPGERRRRLDHRHRAAGRWRLDRALRHNEQSTYSPGGRTMNIHANPDRREADRQPRAAGGRRSQIHQPRAARRRRPRRLYLGRARPAARGRADRDSKASAPPAPAP